MAVSKGTFVISLDYEIHWGVFDAMTIENYGENLKNVNLVIDRLLVLCDKYDVKLTFATVGMLFAKTKKELLNFNPELKPTYTNLKFNPYQLVNSVGKNEENDKLHFACSRIKEIQNNSNHEIGTHTYSHYNCLAQGQTLEQFEQDIIAAKNIGKSMGIKVESIVFPKNQVNEPYLDVCYKHEILSFRGTEKSGIYNGKGRKGIRKNIKVIRLSRLIDAYYNLTGNNTYNVDEINKDGEIVNLPSSRFLRPYYKRLRLIESLKVKRITNSMKHAAKNNEMFHLWWHPHNFGVDIDKNFNNLEKIFKEYQKLKLKYEFESITMTDLTKKIINK
jgi:hypothetical protein|tara:strand:- start:1343 stop:2338 length:996 start_codon:yes stop_codon:yes gene_type:complete